MSEFSSFAASASLFAVAIVAGYALTLWWPVAFEKSIAPFTKGTELTDLSSFTWRYSVSRNIQTQATAKMATNSIAIINARISLLINGRAMGSNLGIG